MSEKKNKTMWPALVVFGLCVFLATLTPLNLLFYCAAVVLATFIAANGKGFLAMITATVLAAASALLGTVYYAAFALVTVLAALFAAHISASRGFTAGKSCVVIAVAFGTAFMLSAALAIYLGVGKLDFSVVQAGYDRFQSLVNEAVRLYLRGASNETVSAFLARAEYIAFDLFAKIPAYLVGVFAVVGICGGIFVAGSRPGVRPLPVQLVPTKFMAIAFIASAVLQMFSGTTAFGVTATAAMLALMPAMILFCGFTVVTLAKEGSLGCFPVVFITVSAFTVGLLTGAAYLGAYYALNVMRIEEDEEKK